MQNWGIVLLVLGVIAGLLAFSGVGAGTTLAFMLMTAFFILGLSGSVTLLRDKWRNRPLV